jgi:hypothetical protein
VSSVVVGLEVCRVPRARPWWLERGVYGVLRSGWVTMWKVGYTGVPCGVVQFDAAGHVGRPLLVTCERYAEMLLEKGSMRKVAGGGAEVLTDPDFAALYPTLFAYMTQSTWPDGSAREVSTLSVFADGGMAKCVLKDRAGGVCLWASCPNLTNLFGVLEALLCDPGAEWRVDRALPGQKASRVKK